MDKYCFEIEGLEEFQNIHELEEVLNILNNEAWDLPVLKKGQQFRTELAKKIYHSGEIIALRRNDEKIGFAAFYCNDYINKIGFLSLFAIKKEYRGKGYAHNIFQTVIQTMRESGMNFLKLEVRKDNIKAISFYKKEGLRIVLDDEKTIYMVKDISCYEEF